MGINPFIKLCDHSPGESKKPYSSGNISSEKRDSVVLPRRGKPNFSDAWDRYWNAIEPESVMTVKATMKSLLEKIEKKSLKLLEPGQFGKLVHQNLFKTMI